MSEPNWDELKGDGLAQNLQLQELLSSNPKRAIFRADYADPTGHVREVLVQIFLENGRDPGEKVHRFLEATYFDHPHILRYMKAGTLARDEGTLTYAVTERADAWASRTLAPEEALPFAQHVLSALEYLHTRNLVYCLLSPDTVAPVGTDWKLSDFSQLRLAGNDRSEETLSLAETVETSPPEAGEGRISPAWDIWALGQTLRKALPGYRPNMPDPVRALILACLNVNPATRPTLTQLSTILGTASSGHRRSSLSTAAGN
jgi:serine/threonine protein kinase